MSVLEIRHRSGLIETRPLSKESPLLVGQLPSSDICVDAVEVAPVHCRISWNRKNFEVAAVGPDGVQVNGITIRTAALMADDVIRVGDVDIVLLDEVDTAHAARHDDRKELLSAPASDLEFSDPDPGDARSVSQAELKALSADALPVRPFYLSDQLAEIARQKGEDLLAPPAGPVGGGDSQPAGDSQANPQSERRVGMSRIAHAILDLDDPAAADTPEHEVESGRRQSATERASAVEKIKESLHGPRVRPGEQDPLKSPLVIGLSLGALLLVLSAATIWFVLSREKAERQFEAAESLLRSGQFAESIAGFEQFVRDNPRHKLAPQARAEIGTARVEQAIAGATPAWDKGLEALQSYIDENRQSPQFQESDSPLRKFILQSSDRIAQGAIESARSSRKRAPLAVSEAAVKLIDLYSPADNRPEARFKELAQAARQAEDAVVQQETFDATLKNMDEALTAGKATAAFKEYRRVLARYPAAADNRPLKDRLKKSFELERTLAVRDESPREPLAADPLPGSEMLAGRLTLARRNRSRTDVSSVGINLFVMAEDCLYGVDSATGEPVWRKVIGPDAPFFPVAVSVGQPAVLVSPKHHVGAHELWLVQARSGRIIWRQSLSGRPAGPPLVHEGQIYLATEQGILEQIDLLTGRSTAKLSLSGRIAVPSALSQSGDRIYLPAHENILYVLTRRPLACEQVIWLGHGPGAIAAPALMLRNYLLLAENDSQAACRLRLFDTALADQPPVEIAKHMVAGHVRTAPVIRGKQLYVPSTPERVTAFLVAETGDDKSLSQVAAYQAKNPQGSPIFICAGPDDQMWMFSSSLRRFELTLDSLVPDKQQLATGIAAQPLQSLGDSLFLARRTAYSRAVIFAEAERRQMIVQWQTSLGAGILESTAPAGQDGAVMCVTSLGDLYQVPPQRLAKGGFDLQPIGQVPVPEGLSESLSAVRLGDGRLAVYCGGAEPRLWLPGGDGIAREQKLPQGLQAGPIALGGGLLVALPGRLRLIGHAATDPAVEDLPAPIGPDEPPRWMNLIALDQNQAVVLSQAGRLARLQFGTAPVPHLEEITHWDAGNPVDLPAALGAGRLFLIDSKSRLVMLDARSLEPLAQIVLEASPGARPRPAGNQVVVELMTGSLVAYDVAAKLQRIWELPLAGAWLTGDPLTEDGQLLVALTDGRVLWVDAATGRIHRTENLGQQLNFGPQRWGDKIVVGTLAGTLILVDQKRESGQSAGELQK